MTIKTTETERRITSVIYTDWVYFGRRKEVAVRIPVLGQVSIMPSNSQPFSEDGVILDFPDDGKSSWEGKVAGIKLRVYSVHEGK